MSQTQNPNAQSTFDMFANMCRKYATAVKSQTDAIAFRKATYGNLAIGAFLAYSAGMTKASVTANLTDLAGMKDNAANAAVIIEVGRVLHKEYTVLQKEGDEEGMAAALAAGDRLRTRIQAIVATNTGNGAEKVGKALIKAKVQTVSEAIKFCRDWQKELETPEVPEAGIDAKTVVVVMTTTGILSTISDLLTLLTDVSTEDKVMVDKVTGQIAALQSALAMSPEVVSV